MKIEHRKTIKLALSLSGSLIVFLFFIVFINILTRHYSDETIRITTKNVLEQWSGEDVTVNNRISSSGSGLSLNRRYMATIANRPTTVFIVTITGRTGPYSAVFCLHESGSAEFCGLLLEPVNGTSPADYGITPGMIHHWTQKVTALAQRTGVQYEK